MARNRQSLVFLDTHITVWLYSGLVEKISDTAKQAIDANDLLISPLVKLELQYLFEIGRITVKPDTIIKNLFAMVTNANFDDNKIINLIKFFLHLIDKDVRIF